MLGVKFPGPFFGQKPPALTSINRRKSAINPEIASINVCQGPIFCDFPSVFCGNPPPFKLAPTIGLWSAFRPRTPRGPKVFPDAESDSKVTPGRRSQSDAESDSKVTFELLFCHFRVTLVTFEPL